jgi:hypothetical protein
MFSVKISLNHLLFVLLFEKKNCYKHRQRKRKETIRTFKKERKRENIIDTVTHKRQIMDYNNTDDGFGK